MKNKEEKKEIDENNEDDILYIPEHKSINEAMFPKIQKKIEKFEISKEDIDGIRKLGIVSHTFDLNLEKNLEEKENSNVLEEEE